MHFRVAVLTVSYIYNIFITEFQFYFLAHSLMPCRNTQTRQPSPALEEEPEGSQNDRCHPPSHSQGCQGGGTRHDARHQGTGEEIDITLTDDSGPLQLNSQTAPLCPQTSNHSQATPTPAASQGGSHSQSTSQDVKHFFRKANKEWTVCVLCK